MGTSFGGSDFWVCLGGKTLVMKQSQKSLRRRLVPIPLIVPGMGRIDTCAGTGTRTRFETSFRGGQLLWLTDMTSLGASAVKPFLSENTCFLSFFQQ